MSGLGFWAVALSVVYLAVLLVLQLFWASPRSPESSPLVRGGVLAVQAALVYLPMLEFKDNWVGMPGFLAGSALLALPAIPGRLAAGAVVASMAVAQAFYTGQTIDVVYITLSTTLTALLVYGLTRLASLVTELHEARTELADMAVAAERLRFARDLHDLLGYSLSSITLKTELTHRLVHKNPARARSELVEILSIVRQALADVRVVSSGYRALSLDEECKSVRSTLGAADITVEMDADYHDLPVRVATVIATVLREGVTNLLRHSKADHCVIEIRTDEEHAAIDVVNNGVPTRHDELPGATAVPIADFGGSGINNLSARVSALGGTLTATFEEDERFRLAAIVPLVDDRAPSRRIMLEAVPDPDPGDDDEGTLSEVS